MPTQTASGINVRGYGYTHFSIKSGRETRQPTHWKGAQTMWPDVNRRSGNQWEAAPAYQVGSIFYVRTKSPSISWGRSLQHV